MKVPSPDICLIDHRDRLYDIPILVVDDMEFQRSFIEETFKAYGFKNVTSVGGSKEGLEFCKNTIPGLILLDLNMPDINGFEFCKELRQQPGYETVVVLVQSAYSEPENINKAFSVGATDFIGKPINTEEMMARVKVHLENRMLLEELKQYVSYIDSELSNARAMPDASLPSDTLLEQIISGYSIDINGYFKTSDAIGGDLWGVKELADDKLAVYGIDLSGHGITAALNVFRLHAFIQEREDYFFDPNSCLKILNDKMQTILPVGQYATMFYGVIDTKKDVLTYAAAGSPPPVLLTHSGEVIYLEGKGVPLGVKAGIDYEQHEIAFKHDDILMVYSDALIETPSKEGEFLALEDMTVILKQHKDESASDLVQALLQLLHQHIAMEALQDDLTLTVYKRH